VGKRLTDVNNKMRDREINLTEKDKNYLSLGIYTSDLYPLAPSTSIVHCDPGTASVPVWSQLITSSGRILLILSTK
jgi:hypothetical protein